MISFDVEQMVKPALEGEAALYKTTTLRFSNFREPVRRGHHDQFSAPSVTAEEASVNRPCDVLRAAAHMAAVRNNVHAHEVAALVSANLPLQLVQSSLGRTSRCCALAFVASDDDSARSTLAQLHTTRHFEHLSNTPTVRLNTDTYLQEQKEERARLLERMKHENRAFTAAQDMDREHQQEQRQTALQRRLARKKAEAEKQKQLEENARRAREAAEKAAAEQGITVEELLKAKVITKEVVREKVVEKEVVKEVIEEKIVGPSKEELSAARSEGKAAMQERNQQIQQAKDAAKRIKKEKELAAAAEKDLRALKMKLVKSASSALLVGKDGAWSVSAYVRARVVWFLATTAAVSDFP